MGRALANSTPDAANPFDALGLPATWQPVPVTYRLAKVTAQGPAGTYSYHTLIFDGPTSRTGLAFTDDALRALIHTLQQALTGLTIASTVPPTPNGSN